MGGAKTKRKAPPKKKKATAPKSFNCPFCNHSGSCEVKLDRKAETGAIACRVCGESYQCRVTYLSDPVDVFCEWIDDLERARGGAGDAGRDDRDDDERAGGSSSSSSSSSSSVAAGAPRPFISAARLDGSAASEDEAGEGEEGGKASKKPKKKKKKAAATREGSDSDSDDKELGSEEFD